VNPVVQTRIKQLVLLSALIAGLALTLANQVTAQTFTNLYSFTGGNDGANPSAGLIALGNTLYGTAQYGGTNGNGAVFAINTDGTGFTALYGFTPTDANGNNSDGANPSAGLIALGNTLYGTAQYGGTSGNGTLFKVNTDGTGFTNLYSFTGGGDGANPSGLTLSGNTLYGTARYGGANGNGTVFAINTNGTGFMSLYFFTAESTNSSGIDTNGDGAYPDAGLIPSGNTLYGTAQRGGTNGNGAVFAINTNGTPFMTLHAFTPESTNSSGLDTNSDGANPYAGLILSGNTLYGMAQYGGSSGFGNVFKVNTDGTGFKNLYSFTGGNDGAYPYAGVIASGDTLYGTAPYGGSSGNGTVFAINTNGTGFMTLYGFTPTDANGNNSDGANPYGGLVLSANTLYGTAQYGGSSGNGTLFSLSTHLVANDQLFGHLRAGDGNPIAGVHVYAYDGMGHVYSGTTDANGYYSINVGNGNWDVYVDCGELSSLDYGCPNDQYANLSGGSLQEDFTVQSRLPVLSKPMLTAGRQFQLSLSGNPSNYYTIEFSTNLINWSPLLTTNPPNAQPMDLDFPSTNKAGFYRAYQSGIAASQSIFSFGTGAVGAPLFYVNVTNGVAIVTRQPLAQAGRRAASE